VGREKDWKQQENDDSFEFYKYELHVVLNCVDFEEIQVVSQQHISQEIFTLFRVDDPVDP